MRNYGLLFTPGVLLVLGGCSQPQLPPVPPKPDFRPSSTIREIMKSMVAPQADAIWEAVSIESGPKGEDVKKGPKTDEGWDKLRHQAVTMAEATNLILMEGRQVAAPGGKSDPNNLPPEKIQALIEGDRANWTKFSHELQTIAIRVIKGIDARDADGVSKAGDDLVTACETCHKQYWYPPKDVAAEKQGAGTEAPKQEEKK